MKYLIICKDGRDIKNVVMVESLEEASEELDNQNKLYKRVSLWRKRFGQNSFNELDIAKALSEITKKEINQVSPLAIAAYLSQKGWVKEKEAEGLASLWSRKDSKITLLLPLDNTFADFEVKVEKLITTLANLENKTKTDLKEELQMMEEMEKS